jgi:hypothetical protein
VHHDGPLLGAVVHSGLEAEQAQGAPVAAHVGAEGDEQAEARLEAPGSVGEARGPVLAAPAAVGHERLVEQRAPGDVDHEQARLAGGPRVVDHGERVGVRQQPAALGAGGGAEREAEHAAVEGGDGGGQRLEGDGVEVGRTGRQRAGSGDEDPRRRAARGSPESPQHQGPGSEAPGGPP